MQNWFTRESVVFSLKSFIAAMLALYLALKLGLPRPFWSIVTAYVVSQPFAGATRSKALYRIAGTVTGAIMTACFIPPIVGDPFLVALFFSVWLGGCLYFSMLDRTPRAYAVILAGYSVPIIALPTMAEIANFGAATLFDAALARAEEIIVGSACCCLVHSVFLPRGIDQTILDRLDNAMVRVKQLVGGILSGERGERAKMDRLIWFQSSPERNLSPAWGRTLSFLESWIQAGSKNHPSAAIRLRHEIDRTAPHEGAVLSEQEKMQFNFAMELHHLVNECERCFALRNRIEEARKGNVPDMKHRPIKKTAVSLFTDKRIALISAIAAAMAQALSCLMWFYSGWPTGVCAPVMAGIYCMFFATMDNPIPVLKMQCLYIGLSTVTGGMYLLWLLPSSHSFEMMMMFFAPFLLVLSALTANPATSVRATPFMMLTICSMTMFDMGTSDMMTFMNTEISQTLGVGLSVVSMYLFRTLNLSTVSRSLANMMWKDLAALGRTTKTPSVIAISIKMIDGISLLTPRLAQLEKQKAVLQADNPLSVRHILADLCVGLNMARLLRLEKRLLRCQVPIRSLLAVLSDYFVLRQKDGEASLTALKDQLDSLIDETAALPEEGLKRQAVAILSGIRHDLLYR
ncbi:MAG: FUSC family protein [Oxalobacter sp.]|nr:FUSC family protein [Oxalobacter sp.]